MMGRRRGESARKGFSALVAALALSACVVLGAGGTESVYVIGGRLAEGAQSSVPAGQAAGGAFDYSAVIGYEGAEPLEVNGGVPFYEPDELTLEAREEYGGLDALGRCGAACMLVGPGVDATAKEDISALKPSGWRQRNFDMLGKETTLYNRSHLLARRFGGNNSLENLITGTRHLNQSLMAQVEEEIATYIYGTRGAAGTGNHVLYRVTPVFVDDELVARGVLMEAQSVEDRGEPGELRRCWWCPNVQPGIVIDYASGESALAAGTAGGAYGQ